jgi:hypothetical protein
MIPYKNCYNFVLTQREVCSLCLREDSSVKTIWKHFQVSMRSKFTLKRKKISSKKRANKLNFLPRRHKKFLAVDEKVFPAIFSSRTYDRNFMVTFISVKMFFN